MKQGSEFEETKQEEAESPGPNVDTGGTRSREVHNRISNSVDQLEAFSPGHQSVGPSPRPASDAGPTDY